MAIAVENHLHKTEARWFAVYTRYKREKLVNKELGRKGIASYLPLQQVTRRYTRKVKRLELPLINCYVFVKITEDDYVRVLQTEDVLNYVRFSKNLISIPEREIEILKKVVGEGLPTEVETSQLMPGDAVEITGGNLMGLRGTIVEGAGNSTVFVRLDKLGMALKIEVDSKWLAKANPLRLAIQK